MSGLGRQIFLRGYRNTARSQVWRSRIIIAANCDRKIVFRVPCHLIIHEWLKQEDMPFLVTFSSESSSPILGAVRVLNGYPRGRKCLKTNDDENPGQPY